MPVFVAQLVRGLLTLALAFDVAACDSPTTPSVTIDQQVTMAPGEQVQVTDTSLRIRFEGVVNDSRCPIDAICVLGGDAEVRLTASNDGAPQMLTLHTGSMAPVTFDGFTFRLVELTPYPFSSQPFPPSDYRATLRVTR